MGMSTDPQDRESPEQRVGKLVARLRNHALWDSLLIFSPPLLVAIYLIVYLYRAADRASNVFRNERRCYWPEFVCGGAPNPALDSVGAFRCRLVDEKSEAKDRFLTLATIDVALLACRLGGAAARRGGGTPRADRFST